MFKKSKKKIAVEETDELRRLTERVAGLKKDLEKSYAMNLRLAETINEQSIQISRLVRDKLDATMRDLKRATENWKPVSEEQKKIIVKFPNGSSAHFADSPDQGAQYHGEDNCLLE